jgi:hypothetical protein
MRHCLFLAYCLPMVLALVSQAQSGRNLQAVRIKLADVGPVSCENDSVVLDFRARVKNVSRSTIRLGRVQSGLVRFYVEDAKGDLKLRRTQHLDEDIRGGPPFDIMTARYEVPDEPVSRNETKNYDGKRGFQVEPGDLQASGKTRKVIIAFEFTNVLPNTSFGGIDWDVWSEPVTIWLPKDCELFPEALHQH